ncbi:MAG: DUF1365 domain-containing protein [Woeseiaceae bacterium]|nr:DUF1365 domain-containing protein [Woeseiaceae bacterium]
MESCIFEGRVRHTRRTPARHSFTYRIFLVYLDLGELPGLFSGRWFWSARRAAPARFRREDHLGDPDVPLDEAVRELVRSHTGVRPGGPIRSLTHLSYFGFCFNPVSFYYCFDLSGRRVETIVAEVTNTPWGERHCYVLPAGRGQRHGETLRFQPHKEMHVSPFMPMDVDYDWSFTPPGERVSVFMANDRDGERVFDAAMRLERREISGRSLARVLVSYPLMTLRVMGAIHWQALRLWLKRCPVYPHPDKRTTTVTTR